MHRQPISRNLVATIAGMLTDDPEIFVEGSISGEEIPFGNGLMGSADYEYGVGAERGSPATGPIGERPLTPPMGPGASLGDVRVASVDVYDEHGEPIEMTPEMQEEFTKMARDYFEDHLRDRVQRDEDHNVASGQYED